MSHRVAILDDSPTVRQLVALLLGEAGHEVEACSTWAELEEAIRRAPPELVLLDVEMPAIVGEHIGFALKRDYPELRVVYLSDHDEATLAELSERTGVDGYIRKSADPARLLADIEAELAG